MPHPHFPLWLQELSIASLALAFLCAGVIVVDEWRRPQPMPIMNLVWPLTALFGSVFWLAFYLIWGRAAEPSGKDDRSGLPGGKQPTTVAVAKATSHCGAGCTLGDIIGEWLAFGFPAVALAFGWKSLFPERIFAAWALDFAFAFLLGILFQYFTIAPMRNLSVKAGLAAALKADTASIAAWQVGMYGGVAIGQFLWFAPAYGGRAEPDTLQFWFLMQIAMLCGFATSAPVNWLLLRLGTKEEM